MQLIKFLSERQTGLGTPEITSKKRTLNADPVISRLVCWKNDCHVIQGHDFDVPPFACKFYKGSNSTDLLAVANEDGDILLYDTVKRGSQAFLKCFNAHTNAVLDICWVPGKSQLITVSGDHLAALWDVETSECISRFQKHVESVKSVDICPTDNAIFATGSRDGNIHIWDTRIGQKNTYGNNYKSVISINDAHTRKNPLKKCNTSTSKLGSSPLCSVTAVAFQDSHTLTSAGVVDGVVKVWDLRKTYHLKKKASPTPRYEMPYCKQRAPLHGCTSLVFDSHYKNLYACCTNNAIHKFDCHSYDCVPKSSYTGFKATSYFIKMSLSCDDQYILCGSTDEKAYIWKVSEPGLPSYELPGHFSEVTSVTWSPNDVSKLVTCCDDDKIHVWRSFGGIENENEEILAKCSPYIKKDEHTEVKNDKAVAFDSNDSILSRANSTVRKPLTNNVTGTKKCRINSITNFFNPATPSQKVAPSTSISPSENNEQDFTSDSSANQTPLKKSENIDESNKQNPVDSLSLQSPSSQVLSPCKVLNKDNIMTPFSVCRSLSLASDLQSSVSSPFTLNGNSKENRSSTVNSKKISSTPVQRKRKCPDTVPKAKSRKVDLWRSKNSVKKQRTSVAGTLMKYFCVEISPEKK